MTMIASKSSHSDLIRTINEGDEVQDLSENSDEDMEYQPSKKKVKKQVDFNPNFKFVSSVAEYNQDTWDDLSKYVKRKVKTKTDDKIKEMRSKNKTENGDIEIKSETETDEESADDIEISDDELKKDDIKVKTKKLSKKQQLKQDLEKQEPIAVVEYDEEYFGSLPTYDENASFYTMNLSRPLLKAVAAMGFVHPTPIQNATIPVALLGKDICGCAATGTGKTAAYMLPTLERLLHASGRGTGTRVLVLAPTRELAVQVYQVSRRLAQHTQVQVALAVGGLDLKVQESILRKNPDIVIATPGRLIDHLKNTPTFSLHSIEVLILDEADRMLDEYFAEQMKEIVKMCSPKRQTMLFSATMTEQVKELAAVSLSKPVRLFVDSNKEVAFNLRQEFVRIRAGREGDREAILSALVCRSFRSACMVFVGTRSQAHRLHLLLGLLGVRVAELHGALPQPQRLASLEKFKTGEAEVMIATDVAARGLDISGVKTVINFAMPATVEHYIHRVGRTARAGRAGVSVSLAGEKERRLVKEIVKRARKPVKARVLPPDIIQKYLKKLEILDPQIESILQEEYAERLLSRAENQHNRMEKKLTGQDEKQNPQDRPWFQTPQQRKAEKERLTLQPQGKKDEPKPDSKAKKPNDKKQKKKAAKKLTPEDRAEAELEKIALVQARMAKRNKKPKRIQTVFDTERLGGGSSGGKGVKRKLSNFTKDLTDTSKNAAKRMRYEANKEIRERGSKKKSAFGGKKGGFGDKKGVKKGGIGKKKPGESKKGAGVKGPKGKVFGRPQERKGKKH